jgi:hypothetical protein
MNDGEKRETGKTGKTDKTGEEALMNEGVASYKDEVKLRNVNCALLLHRLPITDHLL